MIAQGEFLKLVTAVDKAEEVEEMRSAREAGTKSRSGEKWEGSRQFIHERCHAHFLSDPVAVVLRQTNLTCGAHFSIFTVQGRIEKSFHQVIRR